MSENTALITEAQQSKAVLYAKMARVMGRLKRLPKSGFNQHFKYAYATESDIADAVREAMSAENVALFVEIAERVKNGKFTELKLLFTFACGDTGATMTQVWYGEAEDGQDKGVNKAATNAEKYFLMKTFLVSTGNPKDDPDEGSDEVKAHEWATSESVQALVARVRVGLIEGASDSEVCKLAGVNAINDMSRELGWNRHASLKAAAEHIKAEFEKQMATTPPAQPRLATNGGKKS